jgi:PKD repeat protein
MRYIILLIIIPTSYALMAQKNDYHWIDGIYFSSHQNNTEVFGGRALFDIDFNHIPPRIDTIPSNLFIWHASTFISNAAGDLQFFSNGCSVVNFNSDTITNGDTLVVSDPGGCNNSGASALRITTGLFTIPLENNRYLIFCRQYKSGMPQHCQTSRFFYHLVDMNTYGGEGAVIEKSNYLLDDACLQSAVANRHANGRDWWILLADNNQGRFYRWLLQPDGTISGPQEQWIENQIVDGLWYCGFTTFSPDGSMLVVEGCRRGAVLYDFDRCSGLLSNNRYIAEIDTLPPFGGFCAGFSPDSRYLYMTDMDDQRLNQYDLTATNLAESADSVGYWDGFEFLDFYPATFMDIHQGPDGKIYIGASQNPYIHTIEYPNRRGVACRVRNRAVVLPKRSTFVSFNFPNYRLGPIDGSSCDTLGIDNLPVAQFRYSVEDSLVPLQVTFTDNSYYQPTSWYWSFGDGTFSQDTSPIHTYATSDTYMVCLIVSNANAADTVCQQVMIGTSSVHDLPMLPSVRVQPNPFSVSLRVILTAHVGVSPQFSLFDLHGRCMAKTTLRDLETSIDTKSLPAGLYTWQVSWFGQPMQVGKVVKMH